MSTTQQDSTPPGPAPIEHRLVVTADPDAISPSVSGICSCGDWFITARPNAAISGATARLMAFSPGESRKAIEDEYRKHLDLVRLAGPTTTPLTPKRSSLRWSILAGVVSGFAALGVTLAGIFYGGGAAAFAFGAAIYACSLGAIWGHLLTRGRGQ